MLEVFVDRIMERIASGKVAMPMDSVRPVNPSGHGNFPGQGFRQHYGPQRKHQSQNSGQKFPKIFQDAIEAPQRPMNSGNGVQKPMEHSVNTVNPPNTTGIEDIQKPGNHRPGLSGLVDSLANRPDNHPGNVGRNLDVTGSMEIEADYKESLEKQKEMITKQIEQKRKDIERLQKSKDQKNKQVENLK